MKPAVNGSGYETAVAVAECSGQSRFITVSVYLTLKVPSVGLFYQKKCPRRGNARRHCLQILQRT
jgi:hypothetical protein